ncbi:MAG: hypothetical protein ACYC6Y_09800 [Thermoguttaceae bacterium]
MPISMCVICLLASMAGAVPAGLAYVGEPTIIEGDARVEAMADTPSSAAPIVAQGRVCGCPHSGRLRCGRTGGAYRGRTAWAGDWWIHGYDYLVAFDYPWHKDGGGGGCAGCMAAPRWSMVGPQATLAPLPPVDIAPPAGELRVQRASAIRRVD